MTKYFGTDGIRGRALKDLTAELAFTLGQAIDQVFKPSQVVIGMDTRESSPLLAYSLASGLNARGVDVIFAGVVSTPMIAYYSKRENMIGVMITASHNPYTDNGIKVFKKGEKTRESDEAKLEAFIENGTLTYQPFGTFTYSDAIENAYLELLKSLQCTKTPFNVLYDSANGANYAIASKVIASLAHKHTQLGNQPNGKNINVQCGSTHMETLVKTIKQTPHDIGFAFDGDGDRVLMVGKDGTIYDGDMIIYIIARYLKKEGKLNHNTVVLTKMSNPGLHAALKREGITPVLTDVGDKYVYEALIKGDYSIGGEASGHIIVRHLLHSGDGLLIALVLMQIFDTLKQTPEALTKDVTLYPLKTTNLTGIDKTIVQRPHVKEAIEKIKNTYDEEHLILVRPSGTENKIRVTVSFKDLMLVEAVTQKIVNIINEEG